ANGTTVLQQNTVSRSGVTEIHVWGRGGNDTIDLSALSIKSLIHGGTGNDTLIGGGDVDTLWGDAGNDIITGNVGNDLLYGGDGNDTLNGGTGNDLLVGGGGNNLLNGGDGDDVLVGLIVKNVDALMTVYSNWITSGSITPNAYSAMTTAKPGY